MDHPRKLPAVPNRLLTALDDTDVTFRFKDYCRDGAERYGNMTLRVDEFIRIATGDLLSHRR